MKPFAIQRVFYIKLLLLPIAAFEIGNNTTNTSSLTGKDYLNQLYSDHLTNYDVRIRPRFNQSETLNITVLFSPGGLTEFDTALQKFTFLTFFVFQWQDEFLKWLPPNYGSISRMKLPKPQIWSPNVKVSKVYGEGNYIGHKTDQVVVLSTGIITWTPEGALSVVCNVRIAYYPFDVQTCVFDIHVADEAKNEVQLLTTGESVLPLHFLQHSEWESLDIIGNAIGHGNSSYIVYEWTLKRRPTFILYTIVLPLLLLSVMNIGIILVPIASGEKGSMATTLFLAYGVFLSSISNSIPHNSTEVSLFVVFIFLLLVFSGATVFYTIVQSKLYFKIGQTHVRFHLPWFMTGGCKRNKTNQAPRDTVTDEHELPIDHKALDAQSDRVNVTWEQLLSTIDIFLFCGFLAVDTIATVIFFMYMSK